MIRKWHRQRMKMSCRGRLLNLVGTVESTQKVNVVRRRDRRFAPAECAQSLAEYWRSRKPLNPLIRRKSLILREPAVGVEPTTC